MPVRLSLCMIVKDEEDHLPLCLESVKGLVDEIIVVDTGSKDRTPDIAKEYGAKVFHFKWVNDFALARNESLRHAEGDYVLWLDADDRIPSEDREKFLNWKETLSLKEPKAYWFTVVSPESGNDLFSKYAKQIRVFPRLPGIAFMRRIHESILQSLLLLGIPIEETDLRVFHQGYFDPEKVKEKAKRNLKMLLTALAEDPKDFVVHWYLSMTYGVLGDYERALFYAKRFLEEGNFEGQKEWKIAALVNVARCLEHLGYYTEAETYLRKTQEEDPENPLGLFFLGGFLFKKGELQKAKEILEKFKEKELRPSTVPFPLKVARGFSHVWLGDIYLQEGKEDMAVKEYERGLREGIENPSFYSNFGVALRRNGDFKRAEEFFRKALSLKEDYIPALTNLGHLLLFEGRNAEARPYFLKAFEKDPNAIDVLLALCVIELGEGKIGETLAYLEVILYNLNLSVEKELDSFKDIGEVFKMVREALLKEGRNYEALLAQRSAEILLRLDKLFPG